MKKISVEREKESFLMHKVLAMIWFFLLSGFISTTTCISFILAPQDQRWVFISILCCPEQDANSLWNNDPRLYQSTERHTVHCALTSLKNFKTVPVLLGHGIILLLCAIAKFIYLVWVHKKSCRRWYPIFQKHFGFFRDSKFLEFRFFSSFI